jgi:hypothetical protein
MISHKADGNARKGVQEARCWLERFVKARWGQHWEYVTIDCDLTLEELEQLGHLDRPEGWKACRRLVRVPVLNDEIALAMWTWLEANTRGTYLEERELRSGADELDTWGKRHDTLDYEAGVRGDEGEKVASEGDREDADVDARLQQGVRQKLIDYSKALVFEMSQQLAVDFRTDSTEGKRLTPLETVWETDPMTRHMTETPRDDTSGHQFWEQAVTLPFSEVEWSSQTRTSGANDTAQGTAKIYEKADTTRKPETPLLSLTSTPGSPASFFRKSSVASGDSGYYSSVDSIGSALSPATIFAKDSSRRSSTTSSAETIHNTKPSTPKLQRLSSIFKQMGGKIGVKQLKKEKEKAGETPWVDRCRFQQL